MPTISQLLPTRLRRTTLLLALLGCVCALALTAHPALADHSQTTILQDDPLMLTNPSGTLMTARELGVSTIRISLRWQAVAPDPNSFRAPKHFNASSPAAYSKSKWAPFDRIVEDAKADGITVDMDLLGGAPLWATGKGMPHIHGYPFHNWEPSAADYGKFVRAVATRYSGNYDPVTKRLDPGNPDDLPRVSFWSIWNEPNYGPSMAPQALPDHAGDVPDSPRYYRSLVDQAWSALHATGHGSDRLLIGELAPRGELVFGNFNMMTPLVFLRALYCLNGSYHELRGHTASLMGCPTTAAGSRSFAARNPALFKASGVSDHPYMRWYPPDREEDSYQPAHFNEIKPNYATLATIGNLERGLNRVVGAYGSHRQYGVWITEFGYITDPPVAPSRTYPYHYPSQATAAYYDNWAEYIAWKDSRIASFDQYLLRDPRKPKHGQGYPSGLINANGTKKAGFAAFRMPLYLPKTTASSRTQSLEVWGAVRPVHFVMLDEPGLPQHVNILFKAKGTGRYVALAVEPISSSEGYFDTHLTFPSSGTVELQWTYPSDSLLAASGTTIYSRTVSVTVK